MAAMFWLRWLVTAESSNDRRPRPSAAIRAVAHAGGRRESGAEAGCGAVEGIMGCDSMLRLVGFVANVFQFAKLSSRVRPAMITPQTKTKTESHGPCQGLRPQTEIGLHQDRVNQQRQNDPKLESANSRYGGKPANPLCYCVSHAHTMTASSGLVADKPGTASRSASSAPRARCKTGPDRGSLRMRDLDCGRFAPGSAPAESHRRQLHPRPKSRRNGMRAQR